MRRPWGEPFAALLNDGEPGARTVPDLTTATSHTPFTRLTDLAANPLTALLQQRIRILRRTGEVRTTRDPPTDRRPRACWAGRAVRNRPAPPLASSRPCPHPCPRAHPAAPRTP
ncbi:hypothetical protein ACFU7T_29000 [Streptomyces sp. NPDC057555]|uniref:hypothetical protein n=1 Tax=Streptomyces sp. NPDC057555 TaxID=3346166 RepID=UPI00368ED9CE